MKKVMGIDIGTTAIKIVTLRIEESNRFALEREFSVPHDLISKREGWAEEDPLVWRDHLINALRTLSAQEDLSSLEAIAVTGMTPALVLLDKNGQPLRMAILQNDMRAKEEIDYLKEGLEGDGSGWYFKATGSHVNSQHIAPRMLWIRRHEREVFDRTHTILGSYDYISSILTGRLHTESNWALESGLFTLDNHIVDEVLDLAGLDRRMLPPVLEPRDEVGHLSDEIAAATGLQEGIRVYAGTADHVASSYSSGAKEDGVLVLKLGGAGDILLSTEKCITDDRMFIDRSPSLTSPYLVNGCTAASGSLLKWIVSQFGGTYRELDEEAEKIAAGSDGLVILPYVLGEKTPIFDPDAKGVIFGLMLHHTKAHVYRAAMEAVAYAFRHHMDVFNEMGIEIKKVYITNGGSTSPLWRSIMADVLKCEVAYIKHNPGSSLGVAVIAAEADGLISADAIDTFLEQKIITRPIEANYDQYDRSYAIYRSLYPKLKDLFRQSRSESGQ